jgi:DEAD/DEAH box helicase domain-containing protein
VRFDYGVLEGYTVLDLAAQTVNLDMLIDLEKHTGRRLRLDAVASATLGIGKTAVGTDALKWWQKYKATGDPEPFLNIAEYCAYDVKVTKCVYEYGVEHGHVKYNDNSGNEQIVAVDWKAG